MASVYLPPDRHTWMMAFWQDGKLIRRSSRETSQRKAQHKADALESGARDGKPIEAGKITLAQGADLVRADYQLNDFRSLKKFEGIYTNHLAPYFGATTKLATIRPAHVTAYATARQEADAANGTINREIAFLNRMMGLAVKGELLTYRPVFDTLEEGPARTGFLEPHQFEAIVANLYGQGPDVAAVYRDIATVAYLTGWRTDSEILPLEWRHVDLKAHELRLDAVMAKNKDGRVFPMTPELVDVFVRRDQVRRELAQAGHVCPFVFVRLVATLRGGAAKASPKVPKRIVNFLKAWHRAARAAGYPGKLPHDCRRTAIRNANRLGITERVGMQMSGHKTRAVFDRYNIVSAADLADARAKLTGLLPPGMTASKGNE